MMSHPTDSDLLEKTQNTARYFTENRHISWILLLVTVIWGITSYFDIPKRKDPEIPVRIASIVTPWPGTDTQTIEQLITRQVEETVAESSAIHSPAPTSWGIKALTLPGVSIVKVQLSESIEDTEQAFNDINLKLDALNDKLPPGAGPIRFNSGFGDTAALLLTVASPKESGIELALRARGIKQAVEKVRSGAEASSNANRTSLVVAFPRGIHHGISDHLVNLLVSYFQDNHFARNIKVFGGSAFLGIDAEFQANDAEIQEKVDRFLQQRLGLHRFSPDAWDPVIIHRPSETEEKLKGANGDKYNYAQLDNFTNLISRNLQTISQVSKVTRSGVQNQQIFLNYSQDRLAAYGIRPSDISHALNAYNTTIPGGMVQADDMRVFVDPKVQLTNAEQIENVIFARNDQGAPVYLRDLFDVHRSYQHPPQLLNFQTWQDERGGWQRSRAISLAVLMRANQQIDEFGQSVNRVLSEVKPHLPDDLILLKTSDQPDQVKENIDLFMTALYEAVLLVVLVAVLGFREWRSALLLMLCIPITLAMTFGLIEMLGIELQQVSVATLIIALGLLVDDPVVAGDAIKRELAAGQPPIVASWLGPTRLASVIMYATITNMVAYIPFFFLEGNTGDFLRSLPIVMGCALAASRLVSMTFVPFLGYYLLRPSRTKELPIEERRKLGFSGFYYRLGSWVIDNRYKVLAASMVFLIIGGYAKSQLKNSFFPDDIQYISYVDIWLKNDATLAATGEAAKQAEKIIREKTAEYSQIHYGSEEKSILEAVTTFVGGGAPRFWFTVTPELQQQNYAQLIVRVRYKEDTPVLVGYWQKALSEKIPGAYVDVKQLQTNPVKFPVAIRISGRATVQPDQEANDIHTLKKLGDRVVDILKSAPESRRVRHDWGEETFKINLAVNSDRASLAGISNLDVAGSAVTGLSGTEITSLREGNLQIPVVARLWPEERAQLSELQNLYVYATENQNKIPLLEIASISYEMSQQRIRRLEQFRTLTVMAYPSAGALPSDIYRVVSDRIEEFADNLPPGYTVDIAGEHGHTVKGFKALIRVMAVSASGIFLCLVLQFRNAIKPLLVLAAVPYGMVAALLSLYIMGTPFGFMAFLGIVSLIGVIVSHVILLFDFIEERHAQGDPFREALLDAGILRLRPVLVTVCATVLALVPLAIHGGPLWQPLCYAQIGGLLFATMITLLLVPVIYSIAVLDLKLIQWSDEANGNKT